MVWDEPIRCRETSAKPISRWAMETKVPGSSSVLHLWFPQPARQQQTDRDQAHIQLPEPSKEEQKVKYLLFILNKLPLTLPLSVSVFLWIKQVALLSPAHVKPALLHHWVITKSFPDICQKMALLSNRFVNEWDSCLILYLYITQGSMLFFFLSIR